MVALAVAQHSGSGGWSVIVIITVLAAAGGLLQPSLSALTSLRRYAHAERALAENHIAEYEAGVPGETPEFARLCRESAEADAAVPRWLRWARQPVWRRIERDLDYFRRTGQS